jgi:hypothetical protein
MLSDNKDAIGFLETVMKDKLLNDLLRERIIANIEKLTHSCSMHNYDAHNSTLNRPVEIKSEQHSTLNGRAYQVTGGGAFSSIEDLNAIYKLITDNPIMLVDAFIDGRLVYNVSFDFNDSDIAVRLADTVDRRATGVKTAPKFMWSDWISASSLTVTYFNLDYYYELRPHASSDLMWAIKNKWAAQQKKIADMFTQGLSTPEQPIVPNTVSLIVGSVPDSKIDPILQMSIPCSLENDQPEIQDSADIQPICLFEIS